MKDTTPLAVHACHELILWLIPQLDKFPRVRRFSLGERLEAALLEVLELLVEAAYSRGEDKLRPLAGQTCGWRSPGTSGGWPMN
jgi:hypothetical protein